MSWLTLLPYIFQVLGWILGKVAAKQETIARFQELVDSAKNDGLISSDAHDRFKNLHQQLMDKFKEPVDGSVPNVPPVPKQNDNKGKS